jgi:crotonobetaine/carnitine-CoA ligase
MRDTAASSLPARDHVVIRHVLERHARETPSRTCAQFEDGTEWAWRDAFGSMAGAASALRQQGIGRGDRVLVMLPNGPALLRAWWGIVGVGATMVPVHTAFRGQSLRHVCMASRATAIVTDPAVHPRLDEVGFETMRITPEELERPDDGLALEPTVEPWDIATINYTSGTTGPAKGVITPHLQTYWGGHDVFGAGAGLRSSDRWLVDTPLFHVAAQQITVAALSAGASIAVRSVFSGSDYWQVVREAGATFAILAGTMGEFLRRQPARDTDVGHGMRVMIAAPLMADHEQFQKRFGISEIITAYGSTETGAPAIGYSRDGLPRGTCGRPRHGIELRLVDDHDLEVADGEAGELVMRTGLPWELNQGYHDDPAASAAAWRNGWFHTGDLCRRDGDGWYYFLDRTRDTLRRRGEMVSTFGVEAAANDHPEVIEAACIAAPGELGEDEVKLFVVVDDESFDPQALFLHMSDRLPYFMVPRFIEVIRELPKTTATTRVKKHELRAQGHGPRCWDRQAAGVTVGRHGVQRHATKGE